MCICILRCYSSVLEECIKLYQQGHVTPVKPILRYGAGDATTAFGVLQDRDRIAKVVLHMPSDNNIKSSIQSADSLVLHPNGSYLLAGGLGGLGRSIATWMVERGARSLIFLSPNAGLKERDKTFFKELESMQCTVSAVAGMVQNLEDVVKAISTATGPIRGVLQLAMVLRVCHVLLKAKA